MTHATPFPQSLRASSSIARKEEEVAASREDEEEKNLDHHSEYYAIHTDTTTATLHCTALYHGRIGRLRLAVWGKNDWLDDWH